jgi:hypothetical protein
LALPGTLSTGDPAWRWQVVELIVERAAALDVGKDEVVACHPRP